MQPSTMYLRLTEGAGEPGPGQRSLPRAAVALLAALLVALAAPLSWAGPALGHDGHEDPAAVRSDGDDEDRCGPGDDDSGDPSATTSSNRRGTARTGTTTGDRRQVTTRGGASRDDSGTTISNRNGTTRTGTSTGGAAAQQTSGDDSGTGTGTGTGSQASRG